MTACGGVGWGYALPDSFLENTALEKRWGLDAGWIYRRTGIKRRPIADPHLATSDLAVSAAEMALEQADIDPEKVGLVILATSTPDQLLPPTAPVVANQLGLIKAGAIDLAGACSGFLYGLTLADSFCKVQHGYVLVIGANILTRRLNWNDPATASLFADGAGAVVWGPTERGSKLVAAQLNADGSGLAQVVIPEGGTKIPFSAKTFVNDGHLMQMDAGPQLFRKAVAAMVDAGRQVLEKAAVSHEEIDHWIPHQANGRLIEEARRKLLIPREKTRNQIAEIGNSSAATIPIVWAKMMEQQHIQPQQRLLLTSVGAGLIAAGLLIHHC